MFGQATSAKKEVSHSLSKLDYQWLSSYRRHPYFAQG